MSSTPFAVRSSRRRPSTYLWFSVAISGTAFFGFSITYFGPMAAGEYPAVSPAVHVHGWSFFLWYLLMPFQAGLVHLRRVNLHRGLGLASLALAMLMVSTGLLVLGVQVDRALYGDGSEFWLFLGFGILSNLLLFAGFYAAAFAKRRRPHEHKRLIMLASVGGLGAATFRIVGPLFAFSNVSQVVGILLPNLFLVVVMLLEFRSNRGVHRIYRIGFPVSVLLTGTGLLLAPTAIGSLVYAGVAWIGRFLGPLY